MSSYDEMDDSGSGRFRTQSIAVQGVETPIDKELEAMLHFKGWLKKESPSAFKSWQDRFFMISNNGAQLAYFEDDKPKSKLKGALELVEFDSVIQKKKEIYIKFSGREFKFKAETEDLATQWVKTINTLIARIKSSEKKVMKKQTTMGGSLTKKDGKKQWKNIDNEQFQIIQQEKELSTSNLSTEEQKTSIEDQNQLLDKVGLLDYIRNMNQDFINNRLCYGFLGKRSQGKVKYFQKRWFLIISAKPLFTAKYNDELILDESKIPPQLELDMMYYFNPEEDPQMKDPKGDIKMVDCQEIILKDMSSSKESGYTFKINIGDRVYHLMSDTEVERQKWAQATRASSATAKEMKNPLKIKITKNIDPICALYDSTKNLDGRRNIIRQKIDEDLERIKRASIQNQDYLENFQNLIKFLDMVSNDFVQTLNCCLVKDPKRLDIVREFIDYLHEKICEFITQFWDKHYSSVSSITLLQLSSWLNAYGEKMKDFCNDDRLQHGVKVLLNIYINRSVESVEQIVSEIIEFEKKSEPFLNENEQLVTQAPVDLFKIINEGFDIAYNACPLRETVYKLAYFGKVLLKQYQEGVDLLMENEGINIQMLIAFCNNTIQLNTYCKQFSQRLVQAGLNDEEVEKLLDLNRISKVITLNHLKNKKFVTLSNAAKDMFFFHFFGISAQSFKKYYLEVKLDEILKDLIEPAQDPISKLHDSFARKIWKQLLEVIVFYYFNSFIIGCNKAKSNDVIYQFSKFKEKLLQDKETLLTEFDGFIFENQINNCIKPFDDMTAFMEATSLGILEPCQNLRIYFGKAFTQKTVKTLLNLRSDLNKESKNDTLEACANLIADYNKQNKNQVSDIEKLRLAENFGVDEEEENKIDLEEALEQASDDRRRGDMVLFEDEEPDSSLLQEDPDAVQVSNNSIEDELIREGFLFKKKPKEKDFFNSLMVNPMKQMVKTIEKNINILDIGNKVDWDIRYIKILHGYLWIYQNERSRESLGKLDITKVEDIVGHPVKQLIFTLIMEGGKKHKFRAESKELRDLWIKCLGKEINSIINAQQEKIEAIVIPTIDYYCQKLGEGKKPIIKDYEEIERKERQKKKMEDKRQKMKERQEDLNKKKEEKKSQQALAKQHSMMPNIKDNHGFDLGDPDKRASTIFSIDTGSPLEITMKRNQDKGCWYKFMQCLGVEQ